MIIVHDVAHLLYKCCMERKQRSTSMSNRIKLHETATQYKTYSIYAHRTITKLSSVPYISLQV